MLTNRLANRTFWQHPRIAALFNQPVVKLAHDPCRLVFAKSQAIGNRQLLAAIFDFTLSAVKHQSLRSGKPRELLRALGR